MEGRRIRIGDTIDDYCTKCGLIMNHGVVGMIADDVRKVRCNTCMSEHLYKHARLPKRKRDATAKLFNEVLKGLGRETDESEAAGEAGDRAASEARDDDGEAALGAEAAGAAGEEGAATEESEAPEPAPEPARHEVEGHRRKLFTIRRHSGGKPPGAGTPRR